jgi:hypothetical protein
MGFEPTTFCMARRRREWTGVDWSRRIAPLSVFSPSRVGRSRPQGRLEPLQKPLRPYPAVPDYALSIWRCCASRASPPLGERRRAVGALYDIEPVATVQEAERLLSEGQVKAAVRLLGDLYARAVAARDTEQLSAVRDLARRAATMEPRFAPALRLAEIYGARAVRCQPGRS